MSYMKDMEPNHFNIHNNPTRTHLCHCIYHTTLQHMNDNSCYCRAYGRSHLILPRGAQYKERLFPEILELQNHQAPLIDPITKKPFPMKLVGDFRSMDPIFKGCYGDSLLYSDADLGRLQCHDIHLPPYLPHQLLPSCRPNSLRPQSGPHHGPSCPSPQPNSPKQSALAGRVGIITVQDVARTHQLQNALTLPQPRIPLAPRSKS